MLQFHPQIQERFTDIRCPNLKGKPKLFLFNFCRGQSFEKGTIMDKNKDFDSRALGVLGRKNDIVEALKDSYTMYATVDGVCAVRDPQKGTYFIQYLTEVLAQHAHHEHIEDLSKRLYNRMVNTYITTPESKSTLAKKFYLNPIHPTLESK